MKKTPNKKNRKGFMKNVTFEFLSNFQGTIHLRTKEQTEEQ